VVPIVGWHIGCSSGRVRFGQIDPVANGDNPVGLCYAPPSPQLDPWCSGPTCQPVTLEIAGSNPVGSAILASSYAPSARPDGAFLGLHRLEGLAALVTRTP
jgi:hypothetical protein